MRVTHVRFLFVVISLLCWLAAGCGGSAINLDNGVTPGEQPTQVLPDVAELPRTVSAVDTELDFTNPIAYSSGYVVENSGARITATGDPEWGVLAVSGYGTEQLPRTAAFQIGAASPEDGEIFLGLADYAEQTWRWQAIDVHATNRIYQLFDVPLEGQYFDPLTGNAHLVIAVSGNLAVTVGPGWLLASPPGDVYPGDFTVSAETPITLLDGYEVLGGHLTIGAENDSLASLSDLRFIGGELTIETSNGSDALANLRELESLETIGCNLSVSFVQSLNELALPDLAFVGGSVWAIENPELETISFDNLKEVGRHWDIIQGASCYFKDNPKLATLELPALTTVHYGGVQVNYASTYEECDPPLATVSLPELQHVDGLMQFVYAENLETIEMPKLAGAERISLQVLPALTTVDVGPITEIMEVRLTWLDNLPTLEPFSNFTKIDYFYLRQIPLITDVDDMAGLRTVCSLWIEGNDRLTSLDGLTHLDPHSGDAYVINELLIRSNPAFPDGDQTAWDFVDDLGGPEIITNAEIRWNGDDAPEE
ncbi:hypothetical protein JW859_11720 [bacterium]|nr:hypothetical protein [bacterium]